jgi:hypothetical protein
MLPAERRWMEHLLGAMVAPAINNVPMPTGWIVVLSCRQSMVVMVDVTVTYGQCVHASSHAFMVAGARVNWGRTMGVYSSAQRHRARYADASSVVCVHHTWCQTLWNARPLLARQRRQQVGYGQAGCSNAALEAFWPRAWRRRPEHSAVDTMPGAHAAVFRTSSQGNNEGRGPCRQQPS